jgi:hypothetical protein
VEIVNNAVRTMGPPDNDEITGVKLSSPARKGKFANKGVDGSHQLSPASFLEWSERVVGYCKQIISTEIHVSSDMQQMANTLIKQSLWVAFCPGMQHIACLGTLGDVGNGASFKSLEDMYPTLLDVADAYVLNKMLPNASAKGNTGRGEPVIMYDVGYNTSCFNEQDAQQALLVTNKRAKSYVQANLLHNTSAAGAAERDRDELKDGENLVPSKTLAELVSALPNSSERVEEIDSHLRGAYVRSTKCSLCLVQVQMVYKRGPAFLAAICVPSLEAGRSFAIGDVSLRDLELVPPTKPGQSVAFFQETQGVIRTGKVVSLPYNADNKWILATEADGILPSVAVGQRDTEVLKGASSFVCRIGPAVHLPLNHEPALPKPPVYSDSSYDKNALIILHQVNSLLRTDDELQSLPLYKAVRGMLTSSGLNQPKGGTPLKYFLEGYESPALQETEKSLLRKLLPGVLVTGAETQQGFTLGVVTAISPGLLEDSNTSSPPSVRVMHIIPPTPPQVYLVSELATVQPSRKGQEVIYVYMKIGHRARFGRAAVEQPNQFSLFGENMVSIQGEGDSTTQVINVTQVCCRFELTEEDFKYLNETHGPAVANGGNTDSFPSRGDNRESTKSTDPATTIRLNENLNISKTSSKVFNHDASSREEGISLTEGAHTIPTASFPVVGFNNHKNACFRNSAIQTLFAMDMEYFMNLLSALDDNIPQMMSGVTDEQKENAKKRLQLQKGHRTRFRSMAEACTVTPWKTASRDGMTLLHQLAFATGASQLDYEPKDVVPAKGFQYDGESPEDAGEFLGQFLDMLGFESPDHATCNVTLPFGFTLQEWTVCATCGR